MSVKDCWLPRMYLVGQFAMFGVLVTLAAVHIGNGTVEGLLAAISGSIVGGHTWQLVSNTSQSGGPVDPTATK